MRGNQGAPDRSLNHEEGSFPLLLSDFYHENHHHHPTSTNSLGQATSAAYGQEMQSQTTERKRQVKTTTTTNTWESLVPAMVEALTDPKASALTITRIEETITYLARCKDDANAQADRMLAKLKGAE